MEAIDYYRSLFLTRSNTGTKADLDFEDLTIRQDDVILVGTPKSGTTWMQQILHQIRTKGDVNFNDICDPTVVPHLDKEFVTEIEQVAEPRLFKSHTLFDATPHLVDQSRIVVVIRDPYDTTLSFMKVFWRLLGFDKDMTPAEYEEVMDTLPSHDFASFIASWWPQRHNPNVLIMTFDDLKTDLSASIQKIATFLDMPLNEEDLETVRHYSSFEYMSKNKHQFSGDHVACFLPARKCAHIEEHNHQHQHSIPVAKIRADGGQAGQGRRLLDESVRNLVDKRWKEIIEKEHGLINYDHLYAELKAAESIDCDSNNDTDSNSGSDSDATLSDF